MAGFDDFNSIIPTLYSDLEKHKKDWLIIKSTPLFAEHYRERVQKLATGLNIKVILIGKIEKIPKYLELIKIIPIFAAENNRASEYRVGLQFRREGFRGSVF